MTRTPRSPFISLVEKREPAGNTTPPDPRSQRIRESRQGRPCNEPELAAHGLSAACPAPPCSRCPASRIPAEADPAIGQADQAGVGDGDAVRVAAEIGQHLFGAAEGRLGVDDPFDLAAVGQMRAKAGGLGELGEIAEEAADRRPRRRPQAPPGTAGGRAGRARGPAGRSRAGRRSSASRRRAPGRRPARRNGHADDGAGSGPRCEGQATRPISAPRCFGSAAIVRSVSAAALNRMA